jgi:holo-[acyl-carrier protein] synthase
MLGLGVDIIEIDRIASAMNKSDQFMEKLFTELEKTYILNKGQKSETVAGIFAAKEAVSKVLGTGISSFSWKDIEINHTLEGQPKVVLHRKAKDIALSKGIGEILVSIAHCKTYAIANAMGQSLEVI